MIQLGRKPRPRGLTLAELVLAIALFSMLAVGLYTLMLSSLESTRSAGRRLEAMLVAQSCLEVLPQWRVVTYDGKVNAPPGYDCTVHAAPYAAEPGLVQALCRVQWREKGKGPLHSIEMARVFPLVH
jgi:prepilin-type N-terminal cleavage/methylation domain-containing protein